MTTIEAVLWAQVALNFVFCFKLWTADKRLKRLERYLNTLNSIEKSFKVNQPMPKEYNERKSKT